MQTKLIQSKFASPILLGNQQINPLCILDARAEKQLTQQWDCFQASISRSISMAFTENPLTLQANAPKSVTLYVEVDQSGKVLFKGVEPDTHKAILHAMQIAIDKLPTVSPATKTNVGVTAQVQFRIPILLQN